MPFSTPTTLISTSGARLALRQQPANDGGRAILLICHGLEEHSLRYAAFAAFMAVRGYHVHAFDHRGHGFTEAEDAERGRFAKSGGPEKLIADVMAVRNYAIEAHPGLPVILFGHSMGGMIAASTAEAHPSAFNALAVWNSHLNPGIAGAALAALLRAEKFFKGTDVPSFFGPRLTFDEWAKSVKGARTGFEWLSRDTREVDKYVADPLCGFACSVSLWLDVLSMATLAGSEEAIARLPRSLPVNLVGGGEDPATDNGKAMTWLAARLRKQGINNVHLTIYPGMRHETLNELGREDAMKAFAAWADGVVDAR